MRERGGDHLLLVVVLCLFDGHSPLAGDGDDDLAGILKINVSERIINDDE